MSIIKTDKVDRWIVGSATLALFLSVFLILDERFLFRSNINRSELKSVAKMSRSQNDVRRRVETDIAFIHIDGHEEVYQGDAIFTGGDSEAEVAFKDGIQDFR